MLCSPFFLFQKERKERKKLICFKGSISSVYKILLSTYYVPGIVLSTQGVPEKSGRSLPSESFEPGG